MSELRFKPSRVDGLPNVTEAVVYGDRLELLSDGRWVAFRFADIAKWPRPRWLRRLLARFGLPPSWLPVADRDWFHPPPGRFFRFFTTTPITIYMPTDDLADYPNTTFFNVQRVMREGGYHTFDLG